MSNTNLINIYKTLLKSFGSQHWWPLVARGKPIVKQGDRDPGTGFHDSYPVPRAPYPVSLTPAFEVIVGAILTQNTNWKNVEKAIINLKSKKLLSAEAINRASSSKIEKLIRPSGYFRQKTKKLKIFCKYFIENYDGDIKKLFQGDLIKKRNELLSLHGIGKETADSMLLYAGNKKIFVVDAYTRRLLERLGYGQIKDYDEIRLIFEKSIPKKISIYKEFHALIVELAKKYCFKRKPNCAECPLDKMRKEMM